MFFPAQCFDAAGPPRGPRPGARRPRCQQSECSSFPCRPDPWIEPRHPRPRSGSSPWSPCGGRPRKSLTKCSAGGTRRGAGPGPAAPLRRPEPRQAGTCTPPAADDQPGPPRWISCSCPPRPTPNCSHCVRLTTSGCGPQRSGPARASGAGPRRHQELSGALSISRTGPTLAAMSASASPRNGTFRQFSASGSRVCGSTTSK